MLTKLRLRLTLLCVAMTTAVFAILMAVMAAAMEREYRDANARIFQNGVESVVRKLQTEDVISNEWLAAFETGRRCVAAIENNGQPFFFQGEWIPPEGRDSLVAAAREKAGRLGLDYDTPPLDWSAAAREEFLLGNYRCAVVRFPAEKNWFSVTVLSDMRDENAAVARRRIFCGLVFLGVFLILCVLSWWFTGKAIRPIGENMKQQRAFVAAASHELRSPLAVIKASADAMTADPAAAGELIPRIGRVSDRMARLVDDLLLLANTDARSWQLQLSAVNADVLLIELTEQFWAQARARGIALELDIPEEILPPIRGDRERLGQVFAVLIDNAISHSGTERVDLRLRRDRKTLRVEVADHGTGIPPELRERVFDRFFCADRSRTKQHFGLGLSIARELAALHGGALSLTETAGGGCTFTVALPLDPQARESGAGPERSGPAP